MDAGLSSLRLVTHAYGFEFSLIEEQVDFCFEYDEPMPSPQTISFDPWPANLTHLALDSNEFPFELFKHSAETLTKLELAINNQSQLTALESLVPVLPQLSALNLTRLSPDDPFALSPNLVAFVGALPALATLELTRVTPLQLEHLLVDLPPGSPVRKLATTLLIMEEEDDEWWDADYVAEYMAEWVPTLRRCAKLPAARGLKEWKMGLATSCFDDSTGALSWDGLSDEASGRWAER